MSSGDVDDDDISSPTTTTISSSSNNNNNNNGVVPLRTVLQNFLNLVESYEGQRNCGLDAYEKEFQELKIFSENLKSDPDYQCAEGEKSTSRKKNRYKDILPFDYTRVTLTPEDDVAGSDYINANFIKGASGSSAYIACQGPLSHTVNDFWKMVVECEVQVIVMACMEQESGKHKCEKYWVDEGDEEKVFGHVTVWLKKCRHVCSDFLVRTMRIRFTNTRGETEERNVCQFHYSAWPDHGIPNRVSPLLDMVRLIRECQTSETLPVLVHCSAGCGRTGTICAIDYVWGLLRLGKLTSDFSLFQLVKEMRRQRIAMVQTKDQYILVHRAVKELFQEQLKIIDAHIYANLDHHGFPFKLKQDLSLDDDGEPTYETIEFLGKRSGATSPREKVKMSSENRLVQMEPSTVANNYSISSNQATGSVRLKKNDALLSSISSADDSREIDIADGKLSSDRNQEAVKTEPTPSASSSKSGLLRKPSIVKLKAFFERSPKEGKEKRGPTQLSRAKSDVSSSRFYSFPSPFGNSKRSASPNSNNASSISKITSPNSIDVVPGEGSKEKVKKSSGNKPPLLAKPKLPIKRSKSLKISPDATNSNPSNSAYGESSKSQCSDVSFERPLTKSGSSSSGGFTTQVGASNPIKVCVRQLETPKMQSVVSSSVKPELFTASTHNNEEQEGGVPPRKPSPPVVVDTRKLNPNYTNIGYGGGGSRIKMGVAKEMEDIHHTTKYAANKAGKKKYDTVSPRSLGLLSTTEINGTGGLTRSQSHIWQHEKLQLADRIFSDENLAKSKPNQEFISKRDFREPQMSQLDNSNFAWKSNPPVMKVKPLISSGTNNKFSNNPISPHSDSPSSTNPVNSTTSITAIITKPAIRNRVPKTNPYTNFPLTTSIADRYSPLLKKAEEVPNLTTALFGSQRFKDYTNLSPKTNHNHSASIGNSSESSSSNTGTPRNSLPGTPTQSIDGLYTQQQLKSNSALKMISVLPKATYLVKDVDGLNSINTSSNNMPPKSILKGSLSSSSESDDRNVENNNAKLISSSSKSSRASPSLFSASSSILGSNTPPKMNSAHRTPLLGVRERRNSFRQAVWKEAQNDGQQQQHPQHQHQNSLNSDHTSNTSMQSLPTTSQAFPPLYSSVVSSTYAPATARPTPPVEQSPQRRKDYEPIWPEGKTMQIPIHISSTYVSKDKNNYGAPPASINSTNYNGLATSTQMNHYQNNAERTPAHKPIISQGGFENNDQAKNYGEFQTKLDEIKVLLEGLNTPMLPKSTAAPIPTTTTHPPLLTKPNNIMLKHHRSLKSPSRSQYQQQQQQQPEVGAGLSCFSFKRTNSFESISDQFDSNTAPVVDEEYQPLVHSSSSTSKSPFTFFSDAQQRHNNLVGSSQQSNSMLLTQNRSLDTNSSGGFEELNFNRNSNYRSNSNDYSSLSAETMPIPPPRTKAKKNVMNSSSSVNASNNHNNNAIDGGRQRGGGGWAGLSVWGDSHGSGQQQQQRSTNINDGGSQFEQQQQKQQQHASSMQSNSNGNIGGSSPKSLGRALGAFQAKAASVRSKFANWTEPKEGRGRSFKVQHNGESNLADESGFPIPVHPITLTSTSSQGQTRTTKHQYL